MHGICDQDEAFRVRVECNVDRRRMEMNSISDDAKIWPWETVRCGAQDAKDARVTMVQGPHGVEEVRDHRCSRFHGRGRLFIRCLRVPDRANDAPGSELGDELQHLPTLRGNCDLLDRAGHVRAGNQVVNAVASHNVIEILGFSEDILVVNAIFARVQKGPLDMSPERLGTILKPSSAARRSQIWQYLES